MPVCSECGDDFDEIDEGSVVEDSDARSVAFLYRAVADGEPKREILQLIYDMFGAKCQLRPPMDELNLAQKCAVRSIARV